MKRTGQKGTGLTEACLAFSLMMVAILGCASSIQFTLNKRHALAIKTEALRQMACLAEQLTDTISDSSREALLQKTKLALEQQLPGSQLSWEKLPSAHSYNICFFWTRGETYRFHFIVKPKGLHSFH